MVPVKGYPQYNFQLHSMSGMWKMERADFFPCDTWSEIMIGIENMQFAYAQRVYMWC